MFDRFDVCEAHYLIECEYHVGGWLRERESNQRRMEATHVRLYRMGFKCRDLRGGMESLTADGREIYRALIDRYGFRAIHAACIVDHCRELDTVPV